MHTLKQPGLSPAKVHGVGETRALLCQQTNPTTAICATPGTKMYMSQSPDPVPRSGHVALALGSQPAGGRSRKTVHTTKGAVGQTTKQMGIYTQISDIWFCLALDRHSLEHLLPKQVEVLEQALGYLFCIYYS